MDPITMALLAIQTLISNPRLGGGGMNHADTFRIIGHLIQLVQGGAKTAKALKEFAERIKGMAEAGVQPTPQDFFEFTTRLDAALATVADAKAKVAARKGQSTEPVDPQE
jgi:hypothetical protein